MGCDLKVVTTVAGILVIIQSFVGFVLAVYNADIFYNACLKGETYITQKCFLRVVLSNSENSIRALLIIISIVYVLWGISSIMLMLGNNQNKLLFVKQWVYFTIAMIIADIVFPSILLGVTIPGLAKNLDILRKAISTNDYNVYGNYAVLVLTFTRFGVVTWICNICLAVFVNRRAEEIRNPTPAGYVIGAAAPNQFVAVQGVGNVQQPQYAQQGYILQTQPQHFYPAGSQFAQPHYPPGSQFAQPAYPPASQLPQTQHYPVPTNSSPPEPNEEKPTK